MPVATPRKRANPLFDVFSNTFYTRSARVHAPRASGALALHIRLLMRVCNYGVVGVVGVTSLYIPGFCAVTPPWKSAKKGVVRPDQIALRYEK
jgi:hypothetical protein